MHRADPRLGAARQRLPLAFTLGILALLARLLGLTQLARAVLLLASLLQWSAGRVA